MDLESKTVSYKASDHEPWDGYIYCPYIPLTVISYEKDCNMAVSFEVDTRIKPSTWLPNETSARCLRDKYYESHKKCPICSSEATCQTLVGYTFDLQHPERYEDRNRAECNCGWIGIVHELK